MRDRSFGVTTLAFTSVMAALYSQFAAIALLLTGSVFTVAGSLEAVAALFLGAVFLGVTVAAYLAGFGFWMRKHWSWAAGIAVFAVLIGASILLSIASGNFLSMLLPSIGGISAIAYLQRPAVRDELLGEERTADQRRPATDNVEAAEPAR
jgi:hypothetical protein